MMLTDLVTYLPDDILTKVDRASMAHSLEARVPLLDVPFVETVISLPLAIRLDGGPKGLLKRVLRRYVPAPLVERPKHGFSIPLHRWLRTELREQVTDYLTADAIASHGLWRPEPMEQMVREHLQGERNRGHALWALLMFQIWYDHWYRTECTGARRQLEPAI
jgi:asparagine synthase (glutamine-hydrolysing)